MGSSFFKKIRNIADAFLHPLPIDEKWYQDRLKICTDCPLNSDNCTEEQLTDMQKFRKNTVSGCPEKRFCTACGCCIDRKAAVKVEQCGAVDLGEKPKWTAIEIEDKNNKDFFIENLTPELSNLYKAGGLYYIDFGYVENGKVETTIQVEYPTGTKFTNIIPSCGCTVANIEHVDDTHVRFPIRVSTVNFKTGTVIEKAITVSFSTGNLTKVVNLKLKFLKKP
jgi:hypothetical protein